MAAQAIIDPAGPAYEADVYGWVQAQIALARAGCTGELDWEHIIEELDSVGQEQANALESAVRVLLMRLLKWDTQPERRSRSWVNSIGIQRVHTEQKLATNPSLKAARTRILADAYRLARREASTEMDVPLRSLPDVCPYSWEEAMTRPVEWEGEQA